MPDILRDPIWAFIWPSLAALLMVVSILLAWRQRRMPGLSFRVLTFEPIISRTDEIEGKIQLLFEGRLVKNVEMIIVRFKNSGNAPIVAADYEEPITVNYGRNARVLSVETLGTGPRDLTKVDPQIGGSSVELPKVLMNKGECITLKTLVSEADEVEVSAHIAGVEKIRQVRAIPRVAERVLIGLSLLLGVSSLTLSVLSLRTDKYPGNVAVTGVGTVCGAFYLALAFWLWSRFRE